MKAAQQNYCFAESGGIPEYNYCLLVLVRGAQMLSELMIVYHCLWGIIGLHNKSWHHLQSALCDYLLCKKMLYFMII